ncbi:hypothetical protein GCM10009422_13650 [Brevundimonas kwangchunensis]|uniref:DUF3829 domain-containing protein n=1 Tax=Brevundimonas kwangchunensis TaxID=322163 RepID=A0ABN1GTY7_9CAUL
MPKFPVRGVCAAAAALLLASCGTTAAEKAAEAEAARIAAELAARTPPPIALADSVAESAAIYLSFTRDMATIQGGFASAAEVQAALRRGAAYDPTQLSRGMVAYGAIVALQSPEFVAGVRQYASHASVRQELANNIAADPRWVLNLPGADAGAGLVMAVLRDDIDALSRAADSIETDAYTIQNRGDPRRAWAVAHVADRSQRLDAVKAGATRTMLAPEAEVARLRSAALAGSGLGIATDRRREAPYPPIVEQALALAALAALGEGGNPAQSRTDALQTETVSQGCLTESKLNLYQCLAASRPSYEDMFCLGRHIVRDLATCARGASQPAAIVSVSDVSVAPEPPQPRITPSALQPSPVPAPAIQTPAGQPVTISPTPSPPGRVLSPTERLNRAPGG